jgi:hypothetical protein
VAAGTEEALLLARCLMDERPCAGSSLAMNVSTSALAARKFFFSFISSPASHALDSVTRTCCHSEAKRLFEGAPARTQWVRIATRDATKS